MSKKNRPRDGHLRSTSHGVITEDSSSPIYHWTNGVAFEDHAKAQLRNIARLPFIHRHVAVMPDVHAGIGATVGSVIATKSAIIPAAVGVDLGCFTGDTKIPLLDGKDYEIKSLADSNGEFCIFAARPSGEIVAAKAIAKKTKQCADLVLITLDNGESVRCTPDHEFMLRNGTYKQASSLRSGESLMPLYQKIDKEGYAFVKHMHRKPRKRWERVHWMVAHSGLIGEIPSFEEQTTIIHHKNFIANDNSPDNLDFMGNCDHAKFHRSIGVNNTHWQSPDFEEKRKAAIAALAATEHGYAMMSERGTRNIVKYMTENREEFLEKVSGNGRRGAEFLRKYNMSDKGKEKSRIVSNTVYTCEFCGDKIKSPSAFAHHKKKHENNHKVISVTTLSEKEDVYCLIVPGHNNFAISAGVFVHNCGMIACMTDLTASDLPTSLSSLRSEIEASVPHGRSDNGGTHDVGSWRGDSPDIVESAWLGLEAGYRRIMEDKVRAGKISPMNQLGTLGTGNHFIEVCLDESDRVWIMLHSGSRGIGNAIGSHYIELAKQDMKKWFVNLPDMNLAYFPEGTDHFDKYVMAVEWAQNYARVNREVMFALTVKSMEKNLHRKIDASMLAISCHHNYISRENHFGENVIVTRKGAVSARLGQLGIIPGSMGARSYIVRGKGCADSFTSCSHGAGRKMSRTEAERTFTLKDHISATSGIECRKDKGVIDETPMAYKDIDAVMNAQHELVDIVHTLRQVLCIKG